MSAPTSPPTSRRGKGKLIACNVRFLDDTVHTFHLPMKSVGQVLFDESVRKLRLLESDYFDLEYTDVRGMSCWLDHDKQILRQLPQHALDLRFVVKFYTPDPSLMEEEYTRYLFALQVKRDLVTGAMTCQEHTAILLASYIVQSECGDYCEEEFGPGPEYLQHFRVLPHQNEQIDIKIMEHHKEHFGQSPAIADFNLLDTARKVELYGIQMYPAKDHEGVSLQLSVAHMGVLVFQNVTKINTFSWAKIRKLSFRRKKFLVKLHPEGYSYYKDTVEFYFESRNACKNFWKRCIEHHAFFRCQTVKRLPRNRPRVVSRGSSFRYSGRTQKQLVEFVRENCVQRPDFHRSTSMRTMSASQCATPRTGTLNSRAGRATSAPGSARSGASHAASALSPVKTRAATLEHKSRRREAPLPSQSRSLQTFRVPADETLPPAHVIPQTSETLPPMSNVSRSKSAGDHQSAVDDFHCEYNYARQGSIHLETIDNNVDTHDDVDHTCYARRDNLSQDSYLVTDSRGSSLDRLDSVRKKTATTDSHGVTSEEELEMVGDGEVVLDEARLIRRLEIEQRLQEGSDRHEQNGGGDDGGDVCVVNAEWEIPGGMEGEGDGECRQTTEVETIVSVETTRTVETVERRRVSPQRESYMRRKRLSRENAVRVVDEDAATPPTDRKSLPPKERESFPPTEKEQDANNSPPPLVAAVVADSNGVNAAAVVSKQRSPANDKRTQRLSADEMTLKIDAVKVIQQIFSDDQTRETNVDDISMSPVEDSQLLLASGVSDNDEVIEGVEEAKLQVNEEQVSDTGVLKVNRNLDDIGFIDDELPVDERVSIVDNEGARDVVEKVEQDANDVQDLVGKLEEGHDMVGKDRNEGHNMVERVEECLDNIENAKVDIEEVADHNGKPDDVEPVEKCKDSADDMVEDEKQQEVAGRVDDVVDVVVVGKDGCDVVMEVKMADQDIVETKNGEELVKEESGPPLSTDTVGLPPTQPSNVEVRAKDNEKLVKEEVPELSSVIVPASPVTDGVIVPASQVTDGVIVPPSQPTDGVLVPLSQPTDGVIVPPSQPTDSVLVPPSQPNDGVIVPASQVTDVIVPPSQPSDGVIVPPSQPTNIEVQMTSDTGSEEIPYVLHKRLVRSSKMTGAAAGTPPAAGGTDKSADHSTTAGNGQLYATLPSRHSSRSRSLSPRRQNRTPLTHEQKKAQLEKIKANLVSMAAELGLSRSPRFTQGASGAPARRAFDFMICSRLPHKDAFSSIDDSLSPPREHASLLTRPSDTIRSSSASQHKTQSSSQQSTDVDNDASREEIKDDKLEKMQREAGGEISGTAIEEDTQETGRERNGEINVSFVATAEQAGNVEEQINVDSEEKPISELTSESECKLETATSLEQKMLETIEKCTDETLASVGENKVQSPAGSSCGSVDEKFPEVGSMQQTGSGDEAYIRMTEETLGNGSERSESSPVTVEKPIVTDKKEKVTECDVVECQMEEQRKDEDENNENSAAKIETIGLQSVDDMDKAGVGAGADSGKAGQAKGHQGVRVDGMDSESESEGRLLETGGTVSEQEDDVNRILSECEGHEGLDDTASLLSATSEKSKDEPAPDDTAQRNRDVRVSEELVRMVIEAALQQLAEEAAAVLVGDATKPMHLVHQFSEDFPLPPPPPPVWIPSTDDDFPVMEPCGLSVPEIVVRAASDVDLSTLDLDTILIPPPPPLPAAVANDAEVTVDGHVTDMNHVSNHAVRHAPLVSDPMSSLPESDDPVELCLAEQQLLNELRGEQRNGSQRSSSQSLNDELDADALFSSQTVPHAVDAACRLSESSVDGTTSSNSFSRHVHLMGWLEEQAQIMRVSVSPENATLVISDEDDVEHPVFETSLQDVFAALEAEVQAKPFHVPIAPGNTVDFRTNLLTSGDHSSEDDTGSSLLGATGGRPKESRTVREGYDLYVPEETSVPAPKLHEDKVYHSKHSPSISSEGEVEMQMEDMPDPLEILEREPDQLPSTTDIWQRRTSLPGSSSESENLLDVKLESTIPDAGNVVDIPGINTDLGDVLDLVGMECDVGDVLDAVGADAGNISDLEDLSADDGSTMPASVPCTLPKVTESCPASILESSAGLLPESSSLPAVALYDSSSCSSTGADIGCFEEPDALAALEVTGVGSASAIPVHCHSSAEESDEEGGAGSNCSSCISVSESSAVPFGNFVEQVMRHQSLDSVTGTDLSTEESPKSTGKQTPGRRTSAVAAAAVERGTSVTSGESGVKTKNSASLPRYAGSNDPKSSGTSRDMVCGIRTHKESCL